MFTPSWGRFPIWLIFFRWLKPPTSINGLKYMRNWGEITAFMTRRGPPCTSHHFFHRIHVWYYWPWFGLEEIVNRPYMDRLVLGTVRITVKKLKKTTKWPSPGNSLWPFWMVKWPFWGVKWPPTRGWKGHFESPGMFISDIYIYIYIFGGW